MSVSIDSGILDLSSPKFGLDGFGMPMEKIMIRVVVSSKDGSRKMTVFGTYKIGSKHAQIASREIEKLGREVDVGSVTRFALKDFVEEVSKKLEGRLSSNSLRLEWVNGRTFLNLNEERLGVTFQDVYPSAGKVCGIFECNGKSVKVMLGQDVELFDMQRRPLSGLRSKNNKLILEREFQNPVY